MSARSILRALGLAVALAFAACGDDPSQEAILPESAGSADELIVIERAPPPLDVAAEGVDISAGDVDSDMPFEGPGTNGTIGIGGGGGGSFGGRRGGHRNLRAGGGGKRSSSGAGAAAGVLLPPAAPELGRLAVQGAEGLEFPLRHVRVGGRVSGWLARSTVEQVFGNPFDRPIEAVYTFPLPTSCAVDGFTMTVGGRRIVGVVRERAEARRIYEEAKARGMTASLLDQQRPNVFTQSLANVAPGERVTVAVEFVHRMDYRDGAFEYAMPLVVAPRYASPAADTAESAGTAPAQPFSNPGYHDDPGYDVALSLEVDAGMDLLEIDCPTHPVDVTRTGSATATIDLPASKEAANRDLIVRLRVGADRILPGVVARRTEQWGGFLSAFVVPPLEPGVEDTSPREVIFVLDTSGSMRGAPLDASKRLVSRVLRGMRPFDRFNVLFFAGGSGAFAPQPVEASAANVDAAVTYIEALKGGGGTEMLAGIQAWLDQPADLRYARRVCFLTDGLVSGEAAILATIRERGGGARWMAFGIGSSVNRHLIEGIAEHGRGESEIVLCTEAQAPEDAGDRLVRALDAPLLTDLVLDTGGLPVVDVEPAVLPDLRPGAPLVLSARFTAPAAGRMVLRGRLAGRTVEIPLHVELPAHDEDHPGLESVWARARIHRLSGELLGATGDAAWRLRGEIRSLALEFGLVSDETSFVAVDESRSIGDGRPVRILQPVWRPEGVALDGRPVPAPLLRIAGAGLLVSQDADFRVEARSVTPGHAADQAGVRPGERVARVNGHEVLSAHHLGELLRRFGPERARIEVEGPQGARVVVLR